MLLFTYAIRNSLGSKPRTLNCLDTHTGMADMVVREAKHGNEVIVLNAIALTIDERIVWQAALTKAEELLENEDEEEG